MADEYWAEQPPEHVFAALMGAFRELASVEDNLADGLGFERSEGSGDDPNGGGFITGDHTPASLALAACAGLKRLRASRQAWAEEAMRLELADEARSCTGAGDCRSEVHHEGCLHGDPDASWYCIYPRERVHDPSRDAPALPEADRCTHPECKPTIRAVPWTDDDAELLAVAEARAAADTGERHSLDDVAAEFGVDLGSVLPEGEAQ